MYFSTNFVGRRYNSTSVNKEALSFLLSNDVNSLFSGSTSFAEVSKSTEFFSSSNGNGKAGSKFSEFTLIKNRGISTILLREKQCKRSCTIQSLAFYVPISYFLEYKLVHNTERVMHIDLVKVGQCISQSLLKSYLKVQVADDDRGSDKESS